MCQNDKFIEHLMKMLLYVYHIKCWTISYLMTMMGYWLS